MPVFRPHIPRLFHPAYGLITFLLLAFPLLGTGPARAGDFLKALPEIPLAPGFREIDSRAVLFDKVEGRIAAAEATGSNTPGQARQFYKATLPPLGWQFTGLDKDGSLIFDRRGESLRIRSWKGEGRTSLVFLLVSRQ